MNTWMGGFCVGAITTIILILLFCVYSAAQLSSIISQSEGKHHTEVVVRWLVENVDWKVIPEDEGDGEALLYNLVHLAREGEDYRRYAYEADQDEEIALGFGLFRKEEGTT